MFFYYITLPGQHIAILIDIHYCMFNFFSEIKSKCSVLQKKLNGYQCVLVNDDMLYVEGYKGILTLSDNNIAIKVYGGLLVIDGKGLTLKELSQNTITVSGTIVKIEKV